MATFPSPTLQNLTVEGAATLGTATSAAVTITGGTLDGTVIGGTTPAAISATTLSSSGAATLASVTTSNATVTGGTLNGVVIGGTTPAAISATSLTLPAQTGNEVFASPAGASGAPSFRSLVTGDLPGGIATLAAAQTFTSDNTFTASVSIHNVVLNQGGSVANEIYDNGSNSLAIRTGPTPSSVYFVFGATGEFTAVNGPLKGSNFNTGIAPSTVTVGATPWVYHNTNAYGIWMYFTGLAASTNQISISHDNTTYYEIVNTVSSNAQLYLPSQWYIKYTYTTAPAYPVLIVSI